MAVATIERFASKQFAVGPFVANAIVIQLLDWRDGVTDPQFC